jgi:signal transduction histidine kinase/CheY-like chemotaxis protein
VLSSELQVDKLMAKMTEIILESSAAEFAAMVVKNTESSWSVAAIGTPDGVTSFPESHGLEAVTNSMHRQITTYVLRFKETVFVRNVLEDERFSSVSDFFLARNPDGKAVISIPILRGTDEVLGAVYIEGPTNSFTDRNVTVLRLLVNQISISLANALFLKQIEKVSAENLAMVDLQKRALAQARAAELKAKEAEAIAIKNMHLKEEAAKAKSLFLANVSHELRSPLHGIIGMSEMLKETSLTSKQAGYVDSIRMCSDTLLAVINDLLDFTKLEAGKMSLTSVPLNLSETIHEVVRALSFQNDDKGLETKFNSALSSDLLVYGDPLRVTQIFMNLLSNAYKFTSKGTVTVCAVVQTEDADSITIVFSVIDTGIGIDPKQQKLLFQPFNQVESSSSRKFGGTGLGLSICKALIENMMGGKIWLESCPGMGTTVSFSVKFKKLSEAETRALKLKTQASQAPDQMAAKFPSTASTAPNTPNADRQHAASPAGIIDLSKIPRSDIRICIAEDNLINQKIAISFVQRLGFKCEAFADGVETIAALERALAEGKPYHLVLMDVQMPNLDGYDATRQIRKHKDEAIKSVIVIAMTASAIQGDREKCLEAGMTDYLAKPVR